MSSISDKFFSFDKCDKAKVPFNVVIGGRGTGKTFGGLMRCRNAYYEGLPAFDIPPGQKFLYARTTEKEIQSIADEFMNPFKAVCDYNEWNISAEYKNKSQIGIFREYEKDDTEREGASKVIGYGAAMSVFGNLRGADMSDVAIELYDEFLGEPSKRKTVKNLGTAFLNAYETVCRNRESMGKPPLLVYMFSNATTLDSDVLDELGLLDVFLFLIRKGLTSYTDRDRGVHVEKLGELKIVKERESHAIAKLARGTKYYEHAEKNNFAYDDFGGVNKQNIKHYEPIVKILDLYLYRMKNAQVYYVCRHVGKCKEQYNTPEAVVIFRRYWFQEILYRYNHGHLLFQDYGVKREFFNMFGNQLK